MRDAYIILCHRSPWQVNELAAYLAEGGNDVYIHVDKASDIAVRIQTSERIRLVPERVAVTWADWSVVAATLAAVRCVVSSGKQYRYVHLLSGQCLPAKPRKKLDAVLDEAYDARRQIIEYKRLPRRDSWGRDGGIHRVGTWFPRWIVSKYSPWHRWFWPYTNKWIRLKLRRPLYFVFRPFYSGSQWWSLTGDCMAAVADYAARHSLFRYFFHHTFCSDELFFQTSLSRTLYGLSATDDNRRYLKWLVHNSQSPMNLTEEHWGGIWDSDALFARKFNMQPGETERYLQKLEENL